MDDAHGVGTSDQDAAPLPPFGDAVRMDERAAARFWLEPLGDVRLDRSCQYLVKGLMPARGIHVLYGPPGTGKSFLALDVALHVAAGRAWAASKVRQGGVIYVAAEGGRAFRTRIHAARQHLGLEQGAPFALITSAPNLGREDCDLEALLDDVKVQVKQLGIRPKLVVLDTLARSMLGLDESSSRDMNVFIKNVEKLGDELDALVMLVHHTGKDLDRGMRGSSALLGAADAVWQLKKEPGTLLFNVEKMKDGQSGFDVGFWLEDAHLGLDDDGDPLGTKVVRFPAQPMMSGTAEDREVKRVQNRYKTLHRVITAIVQAGETGAGRGEGLPDGARAMRWTELQRAILEGGGQGSATKSAKTSFNRDFNELVAEGALHRASDWVWLPCDDEQEK